jgi:hypothetical protein
MTIFFQARHPTPIGVKHPVDEQNDRKLYTIKYLKMLQKIHLKMH